MMKVKLTKFFQFVTYMLMFIVQRQNFEDINVKLTRESNEESRPLTEASLHGII